MSLGKKKILSQGASAPAPTPFDPLENFETVTYTGNGSTQKITGYIRKGAAFNGSSSKIVLPNSVFSPSAFTVAAWCNVSTTGAENSIFEFTDTNSGNNQSIVLLSAGNASNSSRFLIRNTTSNEYSYAPSGTPATGWNHYCLTFDGSTAKSYINGIEVDSASFSITNTIASTSEVLLGLSATDRFLNGKIDQVRIFNKAISGTNVATLAAETYASSTKSTTDIFSDGSGVALYELDEDSFSSNFEKGAVFPNPSSSLSDGIISGYTPSDMNTTSYTFSQWVNFSTISGEQYIFSNFKNTSGSYGFYAIKLQGVGNVVVDLFNTSNVNTRITSTAFSAGQWYHIALTWNHSTKVMKFYIDGSLDQTSSALSGTVSTNNNGLSYGRSDAAAVNDFFTGKLDQARIYTSELSASDITKLYQESSQIPTANLVAHYKFEGNADDSVGSYNGTANNITYAGGVYSGTATNVNYLGMAFQPDLVWIKLRSTSSSAAPHALFDSIRGVNQILQANDSAQEVDLGSHGVSSFNSNGFTVSDVSGGNNAVNGAAGGQFSGDSNYVAWNWYAPTSETNTIGTDTATIKKNVDAGFSIVNFTSNGTTNVGHGLDGAPDLIILKGVDAAEDWQIYTSTTGEQAYLSFSRNGGTDAVVGRADSFSSVTSTTFTNRWTGSTVEWIAYCFKNVAGYQKVGSYSGSNSTKSITGLGFAPRFVIIKNATGSGPWVIHDKVRNPSNPSTKHLRANSSASEDTGAGEQINFDSDGFTLNYNGCGNINCSGYTFIYLAIA